MQASGDARPLLLHVRSVADRPPAAIGRLLALDNKGFPNGPPSQGKRYRQGIGLKVESMAPNEPSKPNEPAVHAKSTSVPVHSARAQM
jgi:hypothetical protein